MAVTRSFNFQVGSRLISHLLNGQSEVVVFPSAVDEADGNPPMNPLPWPREPEPDRLGDFYLRRLRDAEFGSEVLDHDRPLCGVGKCPRPDR